MARILLIGVDYYSYTKRIIETFGEMGHKVLYYPIAGTSFSARTVKRVALRIHNNQLDKYHATIVSDTSSQTFDYVIFIQVHHFSKTNIKRLRSLHPEARFVLYNWDSLRTHDYREYLGFFDVVYTFDQKDAESLGTRYLPLFALPEYFAVRQQENPLYAVYFVGAIGTMARFNAVLEFDNFCRQHDLRFRKHLRCSPFVFLKLISRGQVIRGMTLRSLSTEEIVSLAADSCAAFDCANHVQSGYTMRLIENLCAGKKVITLNQDVRNEWFYSPARIHVVADGDYSGVAEFISSPPPKAMDFEEFSVRSWGSKLLVG